MNEALDALQLRRGMLQETMNFMGALAYGLEQVVGRGGNSVAFLAGKKLGRQIAVGANHMDDPAAALVEVNRLLREHGCLWEFGPFEPEGDAKSLVEEKEGGTSMLVVFHDCMIRQSLFSFGHVQKGSLCSMTHGVIAGTIEGVMGKSSELEILHAGENACLKRLVVKDEVIQ